MIYGLSYKQYFHLCRCWDCLYTTTRRISYLNFFSFRDIHSTFPPPPFHPTPINSSLLLFTDKYENTSRKDEEFHQTNANYIILWYRVNNKGLHVRLPLPTKNARNDIFIQSIEMNLDSIPWFKFLTSVNKTILENEFNDHLSTFLSTKSTLGLWLTSPWSGNAM